MLTALSEDGRVPLAPYATYGTEDLARHASGALGERHKACLLQNHGTVVVGKTPGEAYALTETLEEVAEIYYRTKLAGEPIVLTPKEVKEASDKMSAYARPKRSSFRRR
jgi:L-fuculose-phosphate aldolase